MKTFLSKLSLIVVLSMGGLAHAGPFFDAMKANPVVACNTFAIAYANGIYAYAQGAESSADVTLPLTAREDGEAKQVYLDMVDAGIRTAIEFGAPRDKYESIAPVVYNELELACNAARGDLSVIKALSYLSPFVENFIERLETAGAPGARRI